MVYMVTFTINIPQMLPYIPYMDPMGCNGRTCHVENSRSLEARVMLVKPRIHGHDLGTDLLKVLIAFFFFGLRAI